jgi:hypothetical protein
VDLLAAPETNTSSPGSVSLASCISLLPLTPNAVIVSASSAPSAPSNWTGVNSYEGFWSKFNNSSSATVHAANQLDDSQASPYSTQYAANERVNPQFERAAAPTGGFSPAGAKFPFTNTVAPREVTGQIPGYVSSSHCYGRISLTCHAAKPLPSLPRSPAANRESCCSLHVAQSAQKRLFVGALKSLPQLRRR